jgi:hypothetical protein
VPSNKEPILDEILDFMVWLLNTAILKIRCPAKPNMPRFGRDIFGQKVMRLIDKHQRPDAQAGARQPWAGV